MKRLSFALFSLLFFSATAMPASAEWVNLRGITVWNSVGALFNFRVTQTLAVGFVSTEVHDCRTGKSATIGAKEAQEREDVVKQGNWVANSPDGIYETVHKWACSAVTYRSEPRDKWLDPPPGTMWKPLMWSRFSSGPNNFRLVYTHDSELLGGTELVAINCQLRVARVVSTGAPSDYRLVNEPWESVPQGESVFFTACNTPGLR